MDTLDLDGALSNATRAGGISGTLVGLGVARQLGGRLWYPLGLVTGSVTGTLCGRAIARWSRRRAAQLVLEGNRLVLDDIGRQTARFCQTFQSRQELSLARLDGFCSTLGEPLLRQAFHHYGMAALAQESPQRCQHAYFANLLAILHEHRKLQPYIASSLPFIVQRCVTKRLMRFEIGALSLSVSEDVPPLTQMRDFPEALETLRLPELNEFLTRWEGVSNKLHNSKATDWSRIEQRMAYIVGLFRRYHTDPSVLAAPYPGQ